MMSIASLLPLLLPLFRVLRVEYPNKAEDPKTFIFPGIRLDARSWASSHAPDPD